MPPESEASRQRHRRWSTSTGAIYEAAEGWRHTQVSLFLKATVWGFTWRHHLALLNRVKRGLFVLFCIAYTFGSSCNYWCTLGTVISAMISIFISSNSQFGNLFFCQFIYVEHNPGKGSISPVTLRRISREEYGPVQPSSKQQWWW